MLFGPCDCNRIDLQPASSPNLYHVLLSGGKQGHFGISEIGLTLEAICCIIGITWLPRKMNSTKPRLLRPTRCCRMCCSYGYRRF